MTERIWPGYFKLFFNSLILIAILALLAATMLLPTPLAAQIVIGLMAVMSVLMVYSSLRRYSVEGDAITVVNLLPFDSQRIQFEKIKEVEVLQNGPLVDWPVTDFSILLRMKDGKIMGLDNFPEGEAKEFLGLVGKRLGKERVKAPFSLS